jgi:prepilin-type N-terminal cleavage/methylation domain-containing protein
MRKKGFTLIELLVVIAIIALLLSVVVPAMGKAKDYAKRVACCNNARQVVLGISVYSQRYDGKIMPMYDVNSGTRAVSRLIGGVQTVRLDNSGAALLQPHNSYRVYSPSQMTGTKMRPFHLGLLYEERIIDTPALFYCPAQPRSTAGYIIPYYYDFYIGQGNQSD